MTLVNVERIKLFTTRSPYWCLAAVFVAVLGFAVIFGSVDGGRQASTSVSQLGFNLGLPIFMVLAALAVTTEYRFGTIRSTFLAVPQRPKVLIAKTVLLAVLGGVVGVVGGLAAYSLTKTLAGDASTDLQLSTGADYRIVLGHGVLLAVGAIIAVAVATMVRQSAGAIAIVLLWPFLAEQLFSLIPTIGPKVQPWLPFSAANAFVSGGSTSPFGPTNGPTPIQGLLVFVGSAVVLWVLALVLLQRRDA
ncbi:ABC transporter permease [Nakamurella flavida]|uniref:ABC transporter permease n=1 Tax=Nakamurella flavida TaxID=363630 RepID=A0A938YIL3_9ACTN|nr:ABC transporter permease [Nakamurella flavida]MBM9476632.1 ABC transporter permease [Nakamurella flavida]MDP9778930.1 ABC-2 type transport system permease protein [Nakamurella flavida]